MQFKKIKVNKEVVSKVSGGAYVISSGLYDVIIKAVTLDVNDKGARTAGLFVEIGGNDQMLYGALPLDLNDGSKELEENVATLQRIAVIGDVSELDVEENVLPIGKNGADKEIYTFKDLYDFPARIWVKQEFSRGKDGNIYEHRILKDIFTETNASADEIVNQTEVGVKFAKKEKYFTDTKYKDVTPEEVEEWIANDRPKASSSATNTNKPSFNKKKFGA